jgi:GAF domain-containing protein
MNTISRAERLAREAFEGACGRAVGEHDLRFAWIGLADWTQSRVVPLASAGDGFGYLDVICVALDRTTALGRGPAGRAIREGRARTVFDIMRDGDFLPWQHAAANRGWRSVAAFPIRFGGAVVAVLAVYAPDVGHFDEFEVAHFERLCTSLGARLDAILKASTPSGPGAV